MSTAKLGVLVIHGIGSQPADYAVLFREKLARELTERGHHESELAWRAVHWAPILQRKEHALLQRMDRAGPLSWRGLREFIVHGFADAIAYQPAPETHTKWDIYHMIHRRIRQDVAALRGDLQGGGASDSPEPPLVVVAHSLGCHIVSNYIWDARRLRGASSFERMETVAGIVFMGCNIALFSLAHKHFKPIAFPHPTLPRHFPRVDEADVHAAARWINLYDADDVLAWPLRTLSEEYAETVLEDIPVNAGGMLTSWNPLSHTTYWSDDSVVTEVANVVEGLLHIS